MNLFKIEQSQNIVIDGIVVRDSSFWNTLVYRSDMVTIQNYKMINCRPTTTTFNNTDGVDFDESTNGKLTNAFLYTGDDSMATKNEEASGTTRTTSSTTRSFATATPSAPRSGPRPWARRSTASYSGTSTSSRRDAP